MAPGRIIGVALLAASAPLAASKRLLQQVEDIVVFGPKCKGDDCLSEVSCPNGTAVVKCQTVPPDNGDGAYVDPRTGACAARGSAMGEETYAEASCVPQRTTFSVSNDALFLDERTISVSCPAGSRTISCNCWSPWTLSVCRGRAEFAPTSDGVCSVSVPSSGGRRRGTESGAGARLFALCAKDAPATTPMPTTPAPAPATRPLFVGADGMICGGRDIQQLLGEPPIADRIRNLPWSSIIAIADEFIRNQTVKVEQLSAKEQELRKAIPAAERAEAPADATDEQLRALVTEALRADGSYGSVEIAQASKCGSVRSTPRPPRGAFAQAQAAYGTAADRLLSAGTVRTTGTRVAANCAALLPDAACTELCQGFADRAQQRSDAAAGVRAVTGRSAASLRTEADAVAGQLKYEMGRMAECKASRGELQTFRTQLEGLGEAIKGEHARFRDARDALFDALWNLEDVGAAVQAQQVTLRELVALVVSRTREENAARTRLQQAEVQSAALNVSVQNATGLLQQANAQVARTEAASRAANQLKAVLSAMLLEMVLYFNAAVRKPLRDLGLGEGVRLESFFPADPSTLREAAGAKRALAALRNFCDCADTRASLAAAAGPGLQLETICDVGDVAVVGAEIDVAVKNQSQAVAENLRQIRTWLNDYRGQENMDKATAERLVAEGEPQGLREVITAYGQTDFYRRYLSNWRASEKFSLLYQGLAKALLDSKAAQARLQATLAALQAQLTQALARQSELAELLRRAMAQTAAAGAQKAAADEKYQELARQQAAVQTQVAELEQAAAAAEARWAAAQKALEDAHRQGMGLVQLFEELEGGTGAGAALAALLQLS